MTPDKGPDFDGEQMMDLSLYLRGVAVTSLYASGVVVWLFGAPGPAIWLTSGGFGLALVTLLTLKASLRKVK